MRLKFHTCSKSREIYFLRRKLCIQNTEYEISPSQYAPEALGVNWVVLRNGSQFKIHVPHSALVASLIKTDSKAFQGEVGSKLTIQMLLKINQQTMRYKDKYGHFWLHDYVLNEKLKNRKPLFIHQNEHIFMSNLTEHQDSLALSALLVVNALKIYKSYQDKVVSTLEEYSAPSFLSRILTFSKNPTPDPLGVCNSDVTQFGRLFGFSRQPSLHLDTISHNRNSRHIVFMYHGNLFKIDVLNKNDEIIHPSIILNTFREIVSKNQAQNAPVGFFTSLNRDDWALINQKMINSPKNSQVLDIIESSLFVLCFDSESSKEGDIIGSLTKNVQNRWFDKTLQIIVSSDGKVNLNVETSMVDKIPILYFSEKLTDLVNNDNLETASDKIASYSVLEWDLCSYVKESLKKKLEAHVLPAPKLIKYIIPDPDDNLPNVSMIALRYYLLGEIYSYFKSQELGSRMEWSYNLYGSFHGRSVFIPVNEDFLLKFVYSLKTRSSFIKFINPGRKNSLTFHGCLLKEMNEHSFFQLYLKYALQHSRNVYSEETFKVLQNIIPSDEPDTTFEILPIDLKNQTPSISFPSLDKTVKIVAQPNSKHLSIYLLYNKDSETSAMFRKYFEKNKLSLDQLFSYIPIKSATLSSIE